MADAAQEQLAALRKEEAEATASLLTELRKPEAQQSADIVSVLRERLAFLRQQILACISATATGAVLVCVKSKLCVCECVLWVPLGFAPCVCVQHPIFFVFVHLRHTALPSLCFAVFAGSLCACCACLRYVSLCPGLLCAGIVCFCVHAYRAFPTCLAEYAPSMCFEL
jgi:hypothetical protein